MVSSTCFSVLKANIILSRVFVPFDVVLYIFRLLSFICKLTLETFSFFALKNHSYQKTSEALSGVTEKTSSLFGGIGGSLAKKLGDVKSAGVFKSFEATVGTVKVRQQHKSSLT